MFDVIVTKIELRFSLTLPGIPKKYKIKIAIKIRITICVRT